MIGDACARTGSAARADAGTASLRAASSRAVGPRNSQDLWIGLSRGVLITSWFVGSFDEFPVLEASSGADQCDEVGCVDGTPAGLC